MKFPKEKEKKRIFLLITLELNYFLKKNYIVSMVTRYNSEEKRDRETEKKRAIIKERSKCFFC